MRLERAAVGGDEVAPVEDPRLLGRDERLDAVAKEPAYIAREAAVELARPM